MWPGKAPETKPTWPPREGNSTVTAADTSSAAGSACSRQERIVAGVEDQRRHARCVEQRLRARARPVVVGVAEAVQRGRDDVVELAQRARAAHALDVEGAGKARVLGGRAPLQRGEEVLRIDERETAPQRFARGREVQGRGDRGGARDDARAPASPRSPSHSRRALPPSETPAAYSGAPLASGFMRAQDPVDFRRSRRSGRRVASRLGSPLQPRKLHDACRASRAAPRGS